MHILKLQCKEKTICTIIHETAQSVIGMQQTQSSLCDGMKSLVYFVTTIVKFITQQSRTSSASKTI